jgi:hypothetical protein
MSNTTTQSIDRTPVSPWQDVRDQDLAAVEGGVFSSLGDLPIIIVRAAQAVVNAVIIGDPVPLPNNLA